MTVCSAGSSPKSGSPQWFTFDSAYIASKFGSVAGWLTTWAMGLVDSPQNTADFCSTDPPTDFPTIADWLKLANPPLALLTGTYTRFGNWIKASKWSDLCECNSSTVPAGTPCYSDTFSTTSTAWAGPGAGPLAGNQWYWSPFPSGTTTHSDARRVRITVHSGTSMPMDFAIYDDLSGGLALQGVGTSAHTVTFNNPGDTWTVDLDSGASTWTAVFNRSGSTSTITALNVTVDYFPAAGQSACVAPYPYTPPPVTPPPTGFPASPTLSCSTEADVCAALSDLSNRLSWARVQIDLIQRQNVPFAYIPGTLHPGLTGAGQLSVQGILGLSVMLTTIPGGGGLTSSDPVVYYDIGWIATGTSDGWRRSLSVSHNPMWIDVSPLDTVVGYTFVPGVVASIQELLREP